MTLLYKQIKQITKEMNRILFVSIIIVFLGWGCKEINKNSSIKQSKYPEVIIPYNLTRDEVILLNKPNIPTNKLKDWIALRFCQDIDSIHSDKIDTVYSAGYLSLKEYGDVRVFVGNFSTSLPETFYKNFCIVFSPNKDQASLFFIDNYNIVKIKDYESAGYFSGVYRLKSKGYYQIYTFEKGVFKLALNTNSDVFCNNGLPVENNSTDCLSYRPFMLNFQNKDFNNDGLLDVGFWGDALIYCEGLETGLGREDGKEKKKVELNIKLIADTTLLSPKWRLIDSSFCSLLSKY